VCLLLLSLTTLLLAQDSTSSFQDLVTNAAAARDNGDVPTAIKLYQQAVQLKPEWPDGWRFIAALQYGAGQYSDAVGTLSRYLELSPASGPALGLRGLCEFETGDYSQSLKDIQHGLSLGANDPRNEAILRYHEALLLALDGEFEDALRGYALFSAHQVTDPEMLVGIGLAGLRTQLLPKDVDPSQRDLFLAAGTAAAAFMAGDADKARREFQDLFRRFPIAVNAHYFYGYLLFAKDRDAAVVEFRHELEIAPSNAVAQVMVAWDFILRNDSSEALPYAEKAETEVPTSPSAQLVLGRSLVETGDMNDGMKHLDTALKLDPGNLEIHLALVKCYSESGRKEDAQRERLLCLEMARAEATTVANP
jgi:tetratricopeptide (TPR) repeat protein